MAASDSNSMIKQNQSPAPGTSLVSVVIPSYNSEDYISQTIDSVLAQTHRELEVIVVDDGSTDATADIVSRYGAPVTLIRQRNQRVCAARNRGFEASRGDFVCFLDHDDVWFPWKVQRQIEAFSEHQQVGVVFTEFLNWTPVGNAFADPSSLDPGGAERPPIDPSHTGWIYHQFLLDCWALTSTVMMRREVFESSGGFDVGLPYSEDWDLWLRLSLEHQFLRIARPSTLYRQHPTQGNKVLRPIDYRTRLLEKAASEHGYASRDGRAVDRREFGRSLARWHMQFGLHQLEHGHRLAAIAAFRRAWRWHPGYWRYPALVAATTIGWQPRPSKHSA